MPTSSHQLQEAAARLTAIPPFVVFGDLRDAARPAVYVSACSPPVGQLARLESPAKSTFRWDFAHARWRAVDAVVRAARPLTEEELSRGRVSREPLLFRTGSLETRQGIWEERPPLSFDEFLAAQEQP